MKVQFTRINPPGWRWRDERRTADWADPFAAALVDGHLVKVSPRQGWTCECPDDNCGHPDAVSALIVPNLLTLLEGEETITERKRSTT
jgi:hypothetical protein